MNYYERVQQAVDYIEERLEDEFELAEVARAAYMSMSNLYRLFFSLVGFPVKESVRLRSMSEAAELIREEGVSVTDIALRFGFSDSAAFTTGHALAVDGGATAI